MWSWSTPCHFPLQLIFEVAFNGPKGGYVALDDISFSPVHCQNQTGKHSFPLHLEFSFSIDAYGQDLS